MSTSAKPNSAEDFPVPKSIEGGCLCGALRYRVDFPKDHDFLKASGSCQCTQCRKQTSSLFFLQHNITPASSFRFTSDTTTLRTFQTSERADRAFCGTCGTFLYWQPVSRGYFSLAVGTIDPLYLFGEAADGVTVPAKGYGVALCGGGGNHEWTLNDIPGVTDNIPILGLVRGERFTREKGQD